MRGTVFYDLSRGQAFREGGESLDLRFCATFAADAMASDYVVIDGALCYCAGFSLLGELLSFEVCPAAAGVELIYQWSPSPVATNAAQLVGGEV